MVIYNAMMVLINRGNISSDRFPWLLGILCDRVFIFNSVAWKTMHTGQLLIIFSKSTFMLIQ